MSEKKNHFKNIFIITLFFLFIFFCVKYFNKEKKIDILQKVVIFQSPEKMKEFQTKIENFKNIEKAEVEKFIQDESKQYLDFFELFTIEKAKRIQVKKIDQINNKDIKIEFDGVDGPSTSSLVGSIKKIQIFDNEIDFDVTNNFKFSYLTFNPANIKNENKKDTLEEQKNKYVKDFFTVLTGTNKKYIEEKNDVQTYSKYDQYFNDKKKSSYLQFISSDNSNKSSIDIQEISLKDKNGNSLGTLGNDSISIHKNYNKIIHDIVDSKNESLNHYFLLEIKFNKSSPPFKIKLFVNEDGYLPIQWPNKINWSGKLGFYYLWNVLIIVIGYFLFFFSSTLGNLGFGIIFTTILIRTISWPIYTKTSTFTLNMSLAQPTIDKIKNKYIFKKDPASAQKMQLEILQVYKKYNIGFLGMLTTFLQIPIFIAMLTTLNRFRVPGGMFNFKNKIFDNKKFLSFIDLSNNYSNNYNSYLDNYQLFLTKALLSFLVGFTMFILNKISFQKPVYLQNKPINIFSPEEKIKKEQTEKSFKIVSYVMIFVMVLASWRDNVLSLYWIIGNTYTIFQTIFNRKQMQKKYFLLKKS